MLYYPVVDCLWSLSVENSPIYLCPTPWVYIYFSQRFPRASVSLRSSITNLAMTEFAWLTVPVLYATARWGTLREDFKTDNLLGDGYMTVPVIGQLSPILSQVLLAMTIATFVCDFAEPALALLVFKLIGEIDWEATFEGRTEGPGGRYLPYNYRIGEVRGLRYLTVTRQVKEVTYHGVSPVYRSGDQATLVSCQA